MKEYIDKAAVVAEINRVLNSYDPNEITSGRYALVRLRDFLDTLEVKEVDLEKERIEECPFRKVGCTMYEDKILECNGACSWVVDYLKLKQLKAQKGE